MPTYALLGATGSTGSAILRCLLSQPPKHLTLNIFVRSRSKLRKAFPDLESTTAFKANIIEGIPSDTTATQECLKDVNVVMACIGSNYSTPGISLIYDTATAIIDACFCQYGGNAVTLYYLPVMLGQAGIKDAHTQLLLNGLNPTLSLVGTTFGAFMADKWGRRPMLFYTAIFGSVCFAILTGAGKVALQQGSKAASNCVIAFAFIFYVVYVFGWNPLNNLYPTECFPMETRAKGFAVQSFVTSVSSAVGSYAGAAALGTIGFWYYLFFVFWDLIEAAVVYLYFPETKGRTLEELNEVFEADNPVKKSLKIRDAETVVETMGKGMPEGPQGQK